MVAIAAIFCLTTLVVYTQCSPICVAWLITLVALTAIQAVITLSTGFLQSHKAYLSSQENPILISARSNVIIG
jgi:hypothetical protein